MSDIIRIQGHSYILATSPRIGGRHLTLKQGDSFAVFDRFGDLGTVGAAEQGVYHRGTRVLSQHEFRLGTQRPLLLSSNAHERHPFVAADLTNPDIQMGEQRVLPRGTIHIFRAQFLWEGALYHRIRVHNYGDVALESDLLFLFDADFLDVFEVRGMKRAQHGTRRHEVGETWVRLCYDGLDGLTRQARLEFSTRPAELTAGSARFSVRLPPDQPIDLLHVVSFEQDPGEPPSLELFGRRREELVAPREPPHAGMVSTTNEYFNHWIDRSVADLHMLVTETDHGPYPYAGVPWFSTVFGRDGLITALQCLWLDPRMAKGVLSLLAHTQASEERASQDAEPGKIVHEMRDGEMANLGEVPYFRYYGSADSTPLFLMLAAAYFERTGDRALIEAIWPNLERALDWIDHYGDLDGDGLVEYSRRRPDGLVNQGWKDSDDSVSHADGALAQGPIALCEVQGYVYAAKRDIAGMAHRCGRAALGGRLEHEAERLRQAVEERFWLEELGTYALALDGAKRPCRVKASNAGHLLFCGLPGRERAHRVADTPAAGRAQLRLGHSHPGRPREALQPHVLPQRLGVAARQRHHRRRPGPLRPDRPGHAGADRPVRRRPARRPQSPARAVLRVHPPVRPGPDPVSGGLHSPGLGRRRGVPGVAGQSGPDHHRRPAAGGVHAAAPAALPADGRTARPAGGRRLDRPAVDPPPPQRLVHRPPARRRHSDPGRDVSMGEKSRQAFSRPSQSAWPTLSCGHTLELSQPIL